MPVTVPFSKSTVFKICRQKMCRFRVNRRPIRHIFHRFQNLPASCERSLNLTEIVGTFQKFSLLELFIHCEVSKVGLSSVFKGWSKIF